MGKRLSAEERRNELRQYLDSVDVVHINKCELARRYGVTDKVIAADIRKIMAKTNPGDVTLILKKFDSAFQLALNRALRSLSDAQGNKETNDSIRTLIAVIHEHLSSLARLGYPVSVDGTPPVKPDAEYLRRYLYGLDLDTDIEQKTPREKIPVPYDNLHWTNPASREPENASPQSQKSIVTTPGGEDDLIPVTNEEIEEEENLNA